MTEISNIKNEFSNRWNLKNFLYLKDGGKNKLNTKSLKIISVLLSVIILIQQLFSPLKLLEIKGEESFSIPVSSQASTMDEPPVYKEGSTSVDRNSQRRNTKPIVVARIKSISFSRLDKIPTGTEVSALLSSGGSNGTVKATLSEALTVDGEILADKGSVLYGTGNSSEERLYLTFSKLIKKDKSEMKIKAQAFDSKDRIVGLKGSKVGDYAFKFAASSGLFILSGVAEGLQDQENAMMPKRKSMRDSALQGVAQASVEQGREIVSKMNNKTIIEVKHSTPIVVIFDDGDSNE